MLLPAIKFKLWPQQALHLDIGCTQISLDDGSARRTAKLTTSLKPGPFGPVQAEAIRQCIVELLPAARERQRPLDISISDALCRCWILPRPAGIATPEEVEALARHQLQSVFGSSAAEASEWAVRHDAMPFASAWPAIALAKSLLELCEDIAQTSNYLLHSVQPRFVRQLNQHAEFRVRPRQVGQTLLQVLSSDEHVTIGIRRGIHWLSLRVHPPLACLDLPLEKLLRRDCRAAGLSREACQLRQVHWPHDEPDMATEAA